jgi:hypothetical protein
MRIALAVLVDALAILGAFWLASVLYSQSRATEYSVVFALEGAALVTAAFWLKRRGAHRIVVRIVLMLGAGSLLGGLAKCLESRVN